MAPKKTMGLGMNLIRPSIPKGLRIKAQGCLSSEVLLTQEGEAFHDMPIQGRRSRDLYGVPALAGKSSELRYALKSSCHVEQYHTPPPEGGTPNRRASACTGVPALHFGPFFSYHGSWLNVQCRAQPQRGCVSAWAWAP